MANAAEHGGVGAAAGGVAYLAMCKYYNRQPTFGEFLLCVGVGLVAAAVPDLVEPALHPHHRQLAHSFTTGGLLLKFATEKCSSACEWDEFQKILLTAASAGYLSHLALD